MIKYIKIFTLCLLMQPISAYASNIVFVDLQKVVDNSVAANKAESEIRGKLETFQNQLALKRTDFQKKSDALKAKSSVLSQEAFEKEKEILIKEWQKEELQLKEKSKKLENLFNLAQSLIRKNIDNIVSKLAQKNNYDAVIPTSQTMYFSEKDEITDKVVELLNKEMPNIDLSNQN